MFYKHFKLRRGNFAFFCNTSISAKKYNINLVHLFVVSVGASISMISISLDRRIVHCGNSVVAGGRVKNGAKMKKTESRKSKKKMAAVFHAVMIV